MYIINNKRYTRIDENNTHPLLTVSKTKNQLKVPNCSNCNSTRTCEFQILPQLLNYLDIDNLSKDSLDYGILSVFTCKNNCSLTIGSYMEDIVIKEDFI